MKSTIRAFMLILTASWQVACALSQPLLVHTTSGTFSGLSVSGNLDRWLGIPFAQAPVGNLMFKAPVQIASPANGVKNASVFGNACPQLPSTTLGASQSEDCLFLNVSVQLHIFVGRELNTPLHRFGVQAQSGTERRSPSWFGSMWVCE